MFTELANLNTVLTNMNLTYKYSKTRPRGLMLTCERIHLLFDLI